MALMRPAGWSDEDSDSDDYGFFEKPQRTYYQQEPVKKKLEVTLQEAIINGSVEEVDELINADLNNNVNMKLDSGWTPLMHACFHAQEDIVRLLLNAGADPNLHADSMTPIMAACSNSGVDKNIIYNIVSLLLDNECFYNIGDKYGQTPLMRAISSGFVDVVDRLLNEKINIEMRDHHGWTALFWASHHNQPEILEKLIKKGARLNEVDRSNRTALDIAISHEHQNIIDILKKSLKIEDVKEDLDYKLYASSQVRCWSEFYPGLQNGEKPNYANEIPNLLYGMNCEKLTSAFMKNGMDLRTFLLTDEDNMLNLGIDMPFQRKRLKVGLKNFHKRGWKLNAVSGLYARQMENFTVLDCLTSLGSHLYQVYVLEATLQYVLKEYNDIQNQIKFEPPDSPVLAKLKAAAKKMLYNIRDIHQEVKIMVTVLNKVNKNNPPPADLIKVKTSKEIIMGYFTEALVVCSLGLLAYQVRRYVTNLLTK